MNDNMIINTISKIHFVIVSFFTFILLVLTTSFIIFQNGLYIDNISVPNIKIKQLYIKWNEKIDISIEEVSIVKNSKKNSKKFNYRDIDKYLKKLSQFSTLFSSVTVEKIFFNDISASFKYKEGEKGFLIASSTDFKLKSYLEFESSLIKMHIKDLKDLKRKITLDGNLFFHTKEIELYSNLHININGDLDANIFLNINEKKLLYKLQNNKKIKDIRYLIDMAHLPKEVKFWAFDAIDMKYLTIKKARGFVNFNKTDEILKNIKIQATVHSLNYLYNPALDSIHAKTTELELKNGILYIYPKKAYSYGMYLNKSWLKIDFTKKEELLTLHLLFNAILNKNTLKILNAYKIKLPFLQKSGTVATNLKIVVGLRSISVDAKGRFFTKRGNFDYLGLNLNIYDALIKLNNYDVRVDGMRATYKDIVKSSVNVRYNAKTAKGSIIFNAQDINLTNIVLQHKNPLKITYNISPKRDTIAIEKSTWRYNDIIFKLDNLKIPFNLDTLMLKIPTTYFEIENTMRSFITGIIDLKSNTASLNTDILTLKYNNIKLNQSNTQLNIQYNKNLKISSKNKISLNIDDFDIDLHNMMLEIDDKYAQLKHTYLSIDNFIYAKINASYNIKDKNVSVNLNQFVIKHNHEIVYQKNNLKLSSKFVKNKRVILSDDLDIKYIGTNKGWDLKINSLEKIAKNSKYLKKFNLTKGEIAFYKRTNHNGISFNANINYPYKILIVDNKNIQEYKINGHILKKEIYFDINDKINVFIDNNIKINAKEIGIDVQELRRINDDINVSSKKKQKSKILLNASNLYFDLGNNRKIISDTLAIQYADKILTAQIDYKKGSAGLKLQDNTFHLYGTNFNDEFMENLLSLSKFRGGTLAFSINGTLKEYKGIFYIKDTTILDYKVLNNVLAFVNTIPSLVTFTLPGYNTKGLKVETSYIKFKAKDGLFNISDAVIDSKEIDIFARGVANLKKDTIDGTINLRTDLASNISKIPIVGYVIFDGDSISTNMSITGKLSNPKVKSLLAKDIIIAPLNIVKRTILLPFKLISDVIGENNSSTQ